MQSTLESSHSDHRVTHTDIAPVVPVQYALVGQRVTESLTQFQSAQHRIHQCVSGEFLSKQLLGIAEGLLVNGIATQTITDFAALPFNERTDSLTNLNTTINTELKALILEKAPAAALMSDFTLIFEDTHNGLELRLKPDFCFAYATLNERFEAHPIYAAIRQLPHHLANALGAMNEADMVSMTGSQIEDYMTLHDKAAIFAKFEAIEADINAIYDEDEDALSLEALNQKYQGIITFEFECPYPSLMESLKFILTYEPSTSMELDSLHDWVSRRIESEELYADPIAIALLDDINALRHMNNGFGGFDMEGDDPLMNMFVMLSNTASKIDDAVWTEVEDMGNNAWNNGFDTHFKLDMTHADWHQSLQNYALTYQIASRYLDVQY